MGLEYGHPSEGLAAELSEVATAAQELLDALHGRLNAPLPTTFPKDQLSDICGSLVQLPEGTAEGCKAPLEYARNRLPAIRREHVRIEGKAPQDEVSLTRGSVLDIRLANLISAVTTALAEYRREAAEDFESDTPPEAGIVPTPGAVTDALEKSKSLNVSLDDAKREVGASTDPASVPADNLRRQLEDARGINRISSAELRMPRVTVSWLRKTAEALKAYPALIRKTANTLRIGVDVLKIGYDRWHEFKQNGVEFIFTELNKTADSFERTAIVLDAYKAGISDSDLRPLPEACISILEKNGSPMTASQIFDQLKKTEYAGKIAKDWPATKPYRRIYAALVHRDRNIGDVINVGSGFWALTVWLTKGDVKKLRTKKISDDRILHGEKTRMGMEAARSRGKQIGQPPKLSADDILKAKKMRDEGLKVQQIAQEFGVSAMTIYKTIPEIRKQRRTRRTKPDRSSKKI